MDANDRHAKRRGNPVDGAGRDAPNHTEAGLDAWFARLDALNDEPFMPEGREQPTAYLAAVSFPN